MRPAFHFIVKSIHPAHRWIPALGGPAVIGLALAAVVASVGIAEAAAPDVRPQPAAAPPAPVQAAASAVSLAEGAAAPEPEWQGRDLDGDGAPDFTNPTGRAPRGHDTFGDGAFHASRDGGARAHEGVDYDARAGQTVVAPISGFVTRIGFAYPGDPRFRYVEIENPALKLSARVFYVDPRVAVGEPVELGWVIGRAHSLQARYAGITDHIHLEIAEGGRRIDAQTVILARHGSSGAGAVLAGMN